MTRASEVRLGGGVLGWLRRSLGLDPDRRVFLRGGTAEEGRGRVVEGWEGGMDRREGEKSQSQLFLDMIGSQRR